MKSLLSLNEELQSFLDCGFDSRLACFTKLVEEVGEYAESLAFHAGDSMKEQKFAGEAPNRRSRGEAVDVLLLALSLCRIEGLPVPDALHHVREKLRAKRAEADGMQEGST